MQDPSVMPEKITALLDSEGATDIDISGYAPMTGGYSRLMARLRPNSLLMGNKKREHSFLEVTLLKVKQ